MIQLKSIFFIIALLHVAKGIPVIDKGEGNLKFDQFRDPYMIDLAESQQCSHDVERICGKTLVKTNFDVIACLQTSFKDYDISEECQNLVWNYKKNVTTDVKYETAVKQICSSMIQQIPECQNTDSSRGHLISCLIEHIEDASIQPLPLHCQSFLKRLEPAVFSDYRVIYKFSDACQSDINRLHCGRVNEVADQQQVPYHSQGYVLTCLALKVHELNSKCKFELLRVSELQGTDYHYDRQLFFACRNDREKFCANVQSGEGRVYRCLVQHKTNPEMSDKCQENLLAHQRLEEEDYKINNKLAKACRDDIFKNECDKEVDVGLNSAKMSTVILCLESVVHEGGKIQGECMTEIKDVRRSLMEDFRLSPHVVTYCSKEIEQKCGGEIRKDGTTIHCLLGLARPVLKDGTKYESGLGAQCLNAVYRLLIEADVVGDYEVDPLLHNSCLAVTRVYCSEIPMNDIYQCLTESLDKSKMTPECRKSLNDLEYFKNRDIKLDPDLYRDCKVDAKEICHAAHQWHIKGDLEEFHSSKYVIACLYRHSWKTSPDPGYKPISRQCASQVSRVMRERALSVNLNPEVEEACLGDLSQFCLGEGRDEKEEEMRCLEDNWSNLSQKCQGVITEYIRNVDRDPDLNAIFLRHCKPVLEKFCNDILPSLSMEHVNDRQSDDLMTCLKANKDDPSMNAQCREGVEHHQLTLLKNIEFSYVLHTSCEKDIKELCGAITNKAEIVICLNEKKVEDILKERDQRLSKACMEQLNFELSQRSENINLDPELQKACSVDIKFHCKHASHDLASTHECLVTNVERLSKGCQKIVFLRIQSEAIDPQTDYHLFTHCHAMIQIHCAEHRSSPETIFSCLHKAKGKADFDSKCRNVVISRSHLFAMDIRLNSELQRACKDDVNKHCAKEMSYTKEEGKHEGIVIECLKSVHIHQKDSNVRLTESCEEHIQDHIVLTSEDFMLDYSLYKFCKKEIYTSCSKIQSNQDSYTVLDLKHPLYIEDKGKMVNCLKDLMTKKTLTVASNKLCHKQVTRVIQESMVDVHADVKLFSACSTDLKRYCDDVPTGEGQQLECLLVVMKGKKLKMKSSCKQTLESRIELWEMAVPASDLPLNLQEVIQMISISPSSNYLFLLIIALVLVIFVLGLCLGRLTNRLRRQIKDR